MRKNTEQRSHPQIPLIETCDSLSDASGHRRGLPVSAPSTVSVPPADAGLHVWFRSDISAFRALGHSGQIDIFAFAGLPAFLPVPDRRVSWRANTGYQSLNVTSLQGVS